MHIPDRVWMLEYCRGLLFTMLPFGLLETLTSTLDVLTAWRTLRIYGSLLLAAAAACAGRTPRVGPP